MAFDGIVTKKIVDELETIKNYKITKIYQPDKNSLILGLYGNSTNLALLVCISSNNYRMHLTTHSQKNPTVAPNFCMLLRKHILGYKIKNIYTNNLERIVFIELENCEIPDKPIYKTLIIELMGKHSNIILTNENNIIIDSIRHTSTEEKSQRDIYPTCRYIFPKSTKYNLLDVSNFDEFNKIIDNSDVCSSIANTFNGISLSFVKHLYNNITLEELYNQIMNFINSDNLSIKITDTKHNIPKDYILDFSENRQPFQLNFALDDFYYSKESSEFFTNYRNTILNLILATLKKYEKRLTNIDDKLFECSNMDKYKLYGELITANLYKITNSNQSSIKLENYYDNNNLIEIPLDKKYSPQYNAKRYFKKYSKLKNALEIVQLQKKETLNDIKYIESIVYELESSNTIEDIQYIYNELSESSIFQDKIAHLSNKKNNQKKNKAKKMTLNKFAGFNPLKYVIDGYTIYVGRNNKENDYLTNKFAKKSDIWFHTKEIHGSHVILKTPPGESIPDNILYQAAKLAASHSKAKNSSNVPVDYCEVRFVKKIPGNKPGLVIYSNNQTIYVE